MPHRIPSGKSLLDGLWLLRSCALKRKLEQWDPCTMKKISLWLREKCLQFSMGIGLLLALQFTTIPITQAHIVAFDGSSWIPECSFCLFFHLQVGHVVHVMSMFSFAGRLIHIVYFCLWRQIVPKLSHVDHVVIWRQTPCSRSASIHSFPSWCSLWRRTVWRYLHEETCEIEVGNFNRGMLVVDLWRHILQN